MNPPVEISPEALEAFRAQVRKAAGVRAIRLGLRGGGCSGFSYVIEFDYGDARTGDTDWNPSGWDELGYDEARPEGNRIYPIHFRIDKKSALYLRGSRLGWKKTLMTTGFEFENPNEASKCGCGHSFNVK